LSPNGEAGEVEGGDMGEEGGADGRRPPYGQHHGEKATVGGAEKYGRRDLERDQDGRKVGERDGKRVVVGVAVVFGLAVTAIINRQHKPRLRRVAGHLRCQGAKVARGPGATRETHNWQGGTPPR